MGRRRIIELVVFGLWLAIAVVCYIHYNREETPVPVPDQLVPTVPDSNEGKSFDVRKITVIRGDTFDIIMRDDTRILAKLPVMAVENAKSKVLDILNHSTNPRVVLRTKQPDGHWIVDLFFTNSGAERNMTEWLQTNNLVYK